MHNAEITLTIDELVSNLFCRLDKLYSSGVYRGVSLNSEVPNSPHNSYRTLAEADGKRCSSGLGLANDRVLTSVMPEQSRDETGYELGAPLIWYESAHKHTQA